MGEEKGVERRMSGKGDVEKCVRGRCDKRRCVEEWDVPSGRVWYCGICHQDACVIVVFAIRTRVLLWDVSSGRVGSCTLLTLPACVLVLFSISTRLLLLSHIYI